MSPPTRIAAAPEKSVRDMVEVNPRKKEKSEDAGSEGRGTYY